MQLNFANMNRFNSLFIQLWPEFITNSPWTVDPFLMFRTPVAVSVRYGQNIPICVSNTPQDLEIERLQWKTQRQWQNLRFVTFAVATHITYTFPIAAYTVIN